MFASLPVSPFSGPLSLRVSCTSGVIYPPRYFIRLPNYPGQWFWLGKRVLQRLLYHCRWHGDSSSASSWLMPNSLLVSLTRKLTARSVMEPRVRWKTCSTSVGYIPHSLDKNCPYNESTFDAQSYLMLERCNLISPLIITTTKYLVQNHIVPLHVHPRNAVRHEHRRNYLLS